jgi:ankyrin repeat protein
LDGREEEYTEIASTLLEKGADINARDNFGLTALFEASSSGSINIVKLLLEKGADVNMKTDNGETALTMASPYANEDGYGTEDDDVVTVIKKHIHDKLMEEVLKTTLIVKKGLRQKRDGLLVPYAQKEIIHRIASFF